MKRSKLITLILAAAMCAALIGAVWASGTGGLEAVSILRSAVGLEDDRGEPVYRAAQVLTGLPEATPTKQPFIIITPKPSATPDVTPNPVSGSDITVTPKPASESSAAAAPEPVAGPNQ